MRCITPVPTQLARLSLSRRYSLYSLLPARVNSFSRRSSHGELRRLSFPPLEISRFQKDAYEFGTRFSDLHLYE